MTKKEKQVYNAGYRAANREKLKTKDVRYYAANRGEILAQRTEYYAANREKIKAQTAAYRAANPEKVKAANKAYNAIHKEERRAYNAAWQKANPEKVKSAVKKWCNANPEKVNALRAAYQTPERLRVRKYGLSPEAFRLMLAAQKNACSICEEIFSDTPNVDHCHKTGEVRGLYAVGVIWRSEGLKTRLGTFKRRFGIFKNNH